MGNNHNKYFGTDRRKVLILGLETAGKTSTSGVYAQLYARRWPTARCHRQSRSPAI